MGIKDQIYTKGIRTTDASKIRADFVTTEDATVVTNLKNAGAILRGKLNMSEFAHGEPQSSAFGPARNPWDLDRSPGVSSTGSGAATAARLCATSLGEDTGGSIRGPAANCGLVGLRPTWGRVSRYGVDGAGWSFDTIGPISRTVEDCAITIGGIAGYDPQDPYTHQVPVPDYQKALTGDLKGLKVGGRSLAGLAELVEGATQNQMRQLSSVAEITPYEIPIESGDRRSVISLFDGVLDDGTRLRERGLESFENLGFELSPYGKSNEECDLLAGCVSPRHWTHR